MTAPAARRRPAPRRVRWRYHFTDFRSGILLATLPLRDVSLSQVLNGPAEGSAVVPLNDHTLARDPFRATERRRTCMWAERQEVEVGGRVIESAVPWGGIVVGRNRKRAARSMPLKLVTFESYWNRRRVGTETFTAADRFLIARAVAAWGCLQADGSTPPHLAPILAAGNLSRRTLTRKYAASSLTPVLEAMDELSTAGDGFDWRLTPYMGTPADLSTLRVRLDLGYPRLGRVAPDDLLWSDWDNDTRAGQLLDYDLVEDGSSAVNNLTGLGAGTGPTQLRSTKVGADVGRDEEGYGYPLYEGTLQSSSGDLKTQAKLDEHVEGALTAGFAEEVRLDGIQVRGDLAPVVTRYLVGDDGRFRLSSSTTGQPVELVGQIVGRTIQPAQRGRNETVTMDVQGRVTV